MSKYYSTVTWSREDAAFVDRLYSRGHLWQFDGGIEIPASASPHVVPLPLSIEAAVDPEEAFVASLSSCHMLWFLDIAARARLLVDDYRDEAAGIMSRNGDGVLAMTRVTLRPEVSFGAGHAPTTEEFLDLHRAAHEQCFIANSVKTEVICHPRMVRQSPEEAS